MTNGKITKKPSFIKSFLSRKQKNKAYLRNLEQDFARLNIQLDQLKRQLKQANA